MQFPVYDLSIVPLPHNDTHQFQIDHMRGVLSSRPRHRLRSRLEIGAGGGAAAAAEDHLGGGIVGGHFRGTDERGEGKRAVRVDFAVNLQQRGLRRARLDGQGKLWRERERERVFWGEEEFLWVIWGTCESARGCIFLLWKSGPKKVNM